MDRQHTVEQLELAEQAVADCEKMLASQRHLVMAGKAIGHDVDPANRLLNLLKTVLAARVATRVALSAEIAPRPREAS